MRNSDACFDCVVLFSGLVSIKVPTTQLPSLLYVEMI
jgi:hypothetical protein